LDGVRDVGAGDAVGAELSVQECDLVPQLMVFVVEFADAFVCECEALAQGVEPTRGERIRTDATTNETSNRGQRRLPPRALPRRAKI
jgi:hypothetical protein